MAKKSEDLPEIDAYRTVYLALKSLDPSAQLRVLKYTAEMLGLSLEASEATSRTPQNQEQLRSTDSSAGTSQLDSETSEETDGINAVAVKWMRRSNLDPKALQKLFSLGIDDIDLVAKSVTGRSKRERMRNVLLLKAIAAYLGTGAARVTYEQLKEAALHYDAYDATNFAAHIKSFAAEVGGTKESGFTLTARGLTAATDLIRSMLSAEA